LGVGDNISVGLLQNGFAANADNQAGFTCAMPLDIDTSTQPSFRIGFRPSATDVGNIIFTLRYTYTLDGDPVYPSLATAPTVANRERTVIVTASGPFTQNTQKTIFMSMNLEGFPTRQEGTNLAPVMWITFERTGTATADTYTGTTDLFDVSGRYLAWTNGGHAAFFN